MKKWYRLDNAGKIFPSVSNARRSNLFRLSITLTEEINPVVLQEALNVTIERFATFNVKLKRGLFWYYLEENKEC
ncbi:MAG TPA: MFS transporter, partial [Bacilli bacterium]|nr:MFS transporter [Bacilli bacterium]